MNFCIKCGTELDSGDAFCGNCGASLSAQEVNVEDTQNLSAGEASPSNEVKPAVVDAGKEKSKGRGRIILIAAVAIFVIAAASALAFPHVFVPDDTDHEIPVEIEFNFGEPDAEKTPYCLNDDLELPVEDANPPTLESYKEATTQYWNDFFDIALSFAERTERFIIDNPPSGGFRNGFAARTEDEQKAFFRGLSRIWVETLDEQRQMLNSIKHAPLPECLTADEMEAVQDFIYFAIEQISVNEISARTAAEGGGWPVEEKSFNTTLMSYYFANHFPANVNSKGAAINEEAFNFGWSDASNNFFTRVDGTSWTVYCTELERVNGVEQSFVLAVMSSLFPEIYRFEGGAHW